MCTLVVLFDALLRSLFHFVCLMSPLHWSMSPIVFFVDLKSVEGFGLLQICEVFFACLHSNSVTNHMLSDLYLLLLPLEGKAMAHERLVAELPNACTRPAKFMVLQADLSHQGTAWLSPSSWRSTPAQPSSSLTPTGQNPKCLLCHAFAKILSAVPQRLPAACGNPAEEGIPF